VIETIYNGRFGNQIFQYCLSRIIAEELGYAMTATLPGFANAGAIDGATHGKPVEEFTGHMLDLSAILANRAPRRLVLNGYFQRYEYFAPHSDRIRQWLSLEGLPFRKPTPGTLVVHVRGGDLYGGRDHPVHADYRPLPFRHYARLIEADTYSTRLAVVCERPTDKVAQKIAQRFDGEIVSLGLFEDFFFVAHAEELVMSMSTFAWWAGWLSEARRIHAPLIGMWHPEHHRNDVDLVVHEERYHYIDLGPGDRWEATPQQVRAVIDD
jgi:hypothetical protein